MKNIEQFPELETKRLILRELKMNDAEAIYTYLSDPDVIKYLEGNTDSIEEAQGYISWVTEGFTKRKDIRWGIELKDTKELIGDCGFGHIDEPRRPTELGYMLTKKYWNHGLMTEALGAILYYGFKELELHRIQAWTHPDNLGSSKLLMKHGFKKEGFHREFIYIWHQDIYIDTEMYAILESDYTK